MFGPEHAFLTFEMPSRELNASDTARALWTAMSELVTLHPVLAKWKPMPGAGDTGKFPVASAASLEKQLVPLPDGGFEWNCWNGKRDAGSCNISSTFGNGEDLEDSFALTPLPRACFGQVSQIVAAVAPAIDSDVAVLAQDALTKKIGGKWSDGVLPGWATYLRGDRPKKYKGPAEQVAEGWLMSTELADIENAEAVEQARVMWKVACAEIKRRGLLK